MQPAHRFIARCLLVTTIACCVSLHADEPSKDEPPKDASTDAGQIAAQMTDLFDLVLDHHVHPVTKQQMVHDSLAFHYGRVGRDMPAELVKEISEAAGNDRIREILRRELSSLRDGNREFEFSLGGGLAAIGVQVVAANEQRVNEQIAANRYVGIGIAIGIHNTEFPVMFGVFPGGPADLAGAKDRDLIIEVNGKSTKGIDITQAIAWLRGVEGSELEIVLRRKGEDKRIELTRGVVPMATVRPPLMSKSGKTAAIAWNRLSASNVHELRQINAKLDANVRKVVLDFRLSDSSNLHYGELLGNALLDDGTIGWVTDRDGEKRQVDAEPGTVFPDRQLVVVIGSNTGGVLKWVAAALHDNGQALLYGDASTAEALTMEAVPLHSELRVKLPTHALSRADGATLTPRLHRAGFRNDMNGMEHQLLELNGGATRPIEGFLVADKPFPFSPTTRELPVAAASLPSQYRIRKLQPLIELIEQDPYGVARQ